MKPIEVWIWGKLVGILYWDAERGTSLFQFTKQWLISGVELSPLMLPLTDTVVQIQPRSEGQLLQLLTQDKGLPLFISDSLPDSFGSQVLSTWLEQQGKLMSELDPVERLTYVGNRGMGALEFSPPKEVETVNGQLNLSQLQQISNSLLTSEPIGDISNIASLFHIGTSPGGAQPKVLINWDRKSNEVYRGDVDLVGSQESWMLKFNRSTGSFMDQDRGAIEYAYYLMAKAAGINMMESQLLSEGVDRYFMTRRFDRHNGEKVHLQTLHAMAGMNFKAVNSFSYEQFFGVFNKLALPYGDKIQLFRMMAFNIGARNVDDHTKNFSFLLAQNGEWRFAPAYDLTFTYNENYGRATPHFLSLRGKRHEQSVDDMLSLAKDFGIKKPKRILNEVNQALLKWNDLAEENGVSKRTADFIEERLRVIPYLLR